MAYEPGAIEAALSAAIGDDAALVQELQNAFLASARAHVAALEDAMLPPEWRRAALRLKGLAASFGALELMRAADAAIAAGVGDLTVLGRVRRLVDGLEH